jgi:hypothetical protein
MVRQVFFSAGILTFADDAAEGASFWVTTDARSEQPWVRCGRRRFCSLNLSLQGFGEYGELGIGFFFGLIDEPFHLGQGGFEVVPDRTCLDD